MSRSSSIQALVPSFFLAATLAGCGARVELDAGSISGDARGPGGASSSASSSAASSSGCIAAPPTPVTLTGARSATLVGDTLHVEATVDGAATYAVLRLDDPAHATLVARRDDLLGPATLLTIDARTSARVRRGTDGAPRAEILDVAKPEDPEVRATATLRGVTIDDDALRAAAFVDGALFVCVQPSAGGDRALATLPTLQSGGAWQDPVVAADWGCKSSPGHDRLAAKGATWAVWSAPEDDDDVQGVDFREVRPGVSQGSSFGYNPSGVHGYGHLARAFADGTRAIAEPSQNPSTVFLFRLPGPTSYFDLAYADFDTGSRKHVLGLADGIAYVATKSDLVAWDVHDIHAAARMPLDLGLPFDGDGATLLASSASRLILADAEGALYVADLAAERVASLAIVASASPCVP